jgi:hypothetical protein
MTGQGIDTRTPRSRRLTDAIEVVLIGLALAALVVCAAVLPILLT